MIVATLGVSPYRRVYSARTVTRPRQAIVSPRDDRSVTFDNPLQIIVYGGGFRLVPGDKTSSIYDYPRRVVVRPANGSMQVFDRVTIVTVFGGARGLLA